MRVHGPPEGLKVQREESTLGQSFVKPKGAAMEKKTCMSQNEEPRKERKEGWKDTGDCGYFSDKHLGVVAKEVYLSFSLFIFKFYSFIF